VISARNQIVRTVWPVLLAILMLAIGGTGLINQEENAGLEFAAQAAIHQREETRDHRGNSVDGKSPLPGLRASRVVDPFPAAAPLINSAACSPTTVHGPPA